MYLQAAQATPSISNLLNACDHLLLSGTARHQNQPPKAQELFSIESDPSARKRGVAGVCLSHAIE